MTLILEEIEIPSGDDFIMRATAKDKQGVIVDITGVTINWNMRERDVTGAIILSKVTPTEINIVDAAAGRFNVNIDAVDTAALLLKYYFHEGQITDGSGNITTSFQGMIQLIQDSVI